MMAQRMRVLILCGQWACNVVLVIMMSVGLSGCGKEAPLQLASEAHTTQACM